MRIRTILAATSILLTALALTPGASAMADPFPTCVTEPCGPGLPGAPQCPPLHADGVVSVALRSDCTVRVGVLDNAYCVGGWGERVEKDVAGNEVSVLVCDGGLTDRLPPITVASASAVRPCPEKNFGVGWTADCDVYIKFYECIWGGHYDEVASAGPVTVYVYNCSPPTQTMSVDGDERDVYTPKTRCNPPAVGYYDRVLDTDYVDVYVWKCTIPY